MTKKLPDSTEPKAPKEEARGRRNAPKIPGERGFMPGQPTNGADLMALWDLPQSAYDSGRLKVSRKKYMTSELEIVGESTISGYSMRQISHDFGPGDFYLNLSADPGRLWGLHNCKVIIAPEYAAANGFQVYAHERNPEPVGMSRVSDANALSATAMALSGEQPVTVRDLAALVEMVSDRTADAIARKMPAGAPPMSGDPMQFFGAVMTMQSNMEERAFKMAERFAGVRSEPAEAPESSFMGDLMKVVPAILAAFAPKTPPPNVQPMRPALQDGGYQPEVADPAAPAAPEARPAVQVPMTQAEIDGFAMTIGMLNPYIGHVVQAIAGDADLTPAAAELADFIPPKLEDQVKDLDKLVNERGPAVLAILAPELATLRGADLIHKISAILTAE